MVMRNMKITALVAVVLLVCTSMQVNAKTLHVDPNDPTAFQSIQEAIIAAKNFDTVVIRPGVYLESIDFIAKAITVRSTDPNDPDIVARTILDGLGSTVVTFQSGEGNNSVLSGLTIRGGGDFGIQCAQSYTRPQIRQCIVTSSAGTGIEGGQPNIVGCMVTQNGETGISCVRANIMECTVTTNGGSGIYTSAGDIGRCIVSDNGLRGIHLVSPGNARVVGCMISGNREEGIQCYGKELFAEIANCIASGNGKQGILGGNSATVTVTNCTVVRNYEDGIYGNRPVAVSNSIVAYNLGQGLRYVDSEYNNVFGNAGGDYGTLYERIGTFEAEPFFADIGYWDTGGTWHNGDYHLMSTLGRWDPVAQEWVKDPIDSACLDKGDPNSPFLDEPYPNAGRINLGAYGGTVEASMSEGGVRCTEYPTMDFNKDCKVDLADFLLFMEHWLECNLDDPDACWPDGIPPTPVVPDVEL